MGPLRGPGSEDSEGVVAASPQIKKKGAAGAEGCGLPCRAMNIIMPPFGGHVHIECHNHSYPRTSLRHFVALFP